MIELNMLSENDQEYARASQERWRRSFKKVLRVTVSVIVIGTIFLIASHIVKARRLEEAENLRLKVEQQEVQARIKEKMRLYRQRREEEKMRLRFEAFHAIVGKLTYEQWSALTDAERQAMLAAAVQGKE